MAADIPEITDSNQEWVPSDRAIAVLLDHIMTDLHDALKMLRDQGLLIEKHDRLLEEFRPLLDQFRSPAATYLNARRARRKTDG